MARVFRWGAMISQQEGHWVLLYPEVQLVPFLSSQNQAEDASQAFKLNYFLSKQDFRNVCRLKLIIYRQSNFPSSLMSSAIFFGHWLKCEFNRESSSVVQWSFSTNSQQHYTVKLRPCSLATGTPFFPCMPIRDPCASAVHVHRSDSCGLISWHRCILYKREKIKAFRASNAPS